MYIKKFDSRIVAQTIYGQFMILPAIGVVFGRNVTRKPRLCFSWLFWGVSVGLGK